MGHNITIKMMLINLDASSAADETKGNFSVADLSIF